MADWSVVAERDEAQSSSDQWQVVGEKDAGAQEAKANQEFARATSLPAQPAPAPSFGKDIISPMAKQPTAERMESMPPQSAKTPTFGTDIISPLAKSVHPDLAPVPAPTHPTAPYGDQAFDHVAVVTGPGGEPTLIAKDSSPQAKQVLDAYRQGQEEATLLPTIQRGAEETAKYIGAEAASLDPKDPANRLLGVHIGQSPYSPAVDVSGEDVTKAYKELVAPAGEAAAEFIGAQYHPQNLALLGAMGLIPEATSLGKVVHGAAAGVFGTQAGAHAVETGYKAYRDFADHNTSQGVKDTVESLLSTGFAVGGTREAAKAGKDLTLEATARPIDKAGDLFRAIVKQAGVDLPKDATFEQAQAAYKQAMRAVHPDVNSTADPETAKKLNATWDVLKQAGYIPGTELRSVGDVASALADMLKASWSRMTERFSRTAEQPASEVEQSGKALPQEAGVRPAVQASDNPEELRKSAAEQEPTLEKMAEAAVAPVPGGQFEGSRVKEPESQDLKEERGKPSETNIDHLGARVSAQDDAGRAQVEQSVEQQLPVVSKEKIDANGLDVTQYGVKTGKPGDANQVSELQVTDKANIKAMEATEDLYEKQKQALASGDKAEADRIGQQIEAKHEEITSGSAPSNEGGKWEVVQEHDKEPKYQHGSTQADIPKDSQAAKVLDALRAQIPEEHLAGKGKDIDAAHVTVRYGLDGDQDKVKAFLEQQAPFEARLGKTGKFEPSESSDGAAVIQAPIEAPELHRINAEIAKHGQFAESNFPEYKPHATIAYVKPEVADKYVGMNATAGKTFTVDQIAITDRQGNKQVVKLGGADNGAQKITPQSKNHEGVKKSAPESATSNRDRFAESYQKHLADEVTKNPSVYGYSASKVPDVARRMVEALAKGSGNKNSPAVRATLKELGIKDTYSAIKEFLNEKPKTEVQPVAAEPARPQAQAQPAQVHKPAAEGESETEAARRGGPGEPPKEELPVNQVPVDQRASTLIPKEEAEKFAKRTESRAESKGSLEQQPASLADHFYDKITAGEMPKDNNALRALVADFDGKPVDNARLKEAQEAMELAIVRRARDIVQNGVGDETIFDKLVALYKSQPNLNIRTSTSIENQAYSTPAPIAFLADRLAGLDRTKTGYEPTAGNGMLTITGDPKKVIANELDEARAKNLETIGLQVKRGDALKSDVKPKSVDSVIANPPFGPLKENGENVKVKVDGYSIGQIDHLIAARALDAMKDDGKASLILGANKMQPGRFSNDDTIFLNWLYSHYNVTGHFEINGDLYNRQGAAWPIRLITINGRVQSDRFSPMEGSIQRADDWKDVYEQYRKGLEAQQQPARVERAGGPIQRTGEQNESPTLREPSAQPSRGVSQREPQGSPAPAISRGGEQPGPARDRLERPATDTRPDHGERANANLPQPAELDNAGREPGTAGERTAEPASDHRSAALTSPDNQYQVGYTAASSKKDQGVLIPTNMRAPLEQALRALEDAVGDLDKFVQKELGYKSTRDLHDAFMGLQVDSVAAAIHQMRQGKAVVIADQTGIGKGRQAAAIIRWAAKNGDIPVFVTAKPSLFTDMYGDLEDIGSDNIKPFIVNLDEWIKSADGKKLFANKAFLHRRNLDSIRATGRLPEDRNAVFLTYSQINQPNTQQQVLRTLAPRAVFILDESHNAGGESNTGEFMRSTLTLAKGVTYLSATYAKRPDNMPLYFKTDMGQAIDDPQALIDAMNEGGLPLQTVVSSDLVKAGQMFRRERSYDGVQMLTKVDTARRQEHGRIADSATEALRSIVAADKAFHETYVKQRQKEAKAEAKRIVGGGNKASQVGHTEFTAVVHNFVRQMLLGIKADSAADDAIATLRRGEKPLIAVDNTMGSFLNAYVGDHAISIGDHLENFDYRTVLGRALNRTRALLLTDRTGDQTRVDVPLDELDPVTRKAYDDAQGVIDKLNIDLPVSPIDWIRMRLENEGYSVSEITGRNLAVDYSESDRPKLGQVPIQEQHDKVETIRRFNDGRLDSLILNVAGSTGISAHASEKFKDQRVRHMIVAQPAQDINIFMQMLGRIHRTGQVKLPKYTILNVDLPAEKRPGALLAKKMKSLNANTSSNTESATSVQAVDMLNKYGDAIIGQYLDDNPKIEGALGVRGTGDNGDPVPDIARKATGRLALLPVRAQEEFYREVEGRYNDFIAYLDATNQNELEPKTFDYDARELKSKVLVEGQNPNSPFGSDAIYGEYSIKMQGKPLTVAEVNEQMDHNLGGKSGRAHALDLIGTLDKEYGVYEKTIDPEHTGMLQRAQESAIATRSFIQNHPIGSAWRVEINGDVYSAAVTNIRSTHKGGGNPYSLSSVNVTLAVNGPMRMISVPATQLNKISVASLYDDPQDIFRIQPSNMREQAKIVTGNLLAAYGEMSGTRGTIINFSKADGSTEQGILLPKKFNLNENTRGDYRLRDAGHAAKFLQKADDPSVEKIGIASRDQNVRVIRDKGRLAIITPKSKARGGQYFLDRKLTDLTGDFVSGANVMRADIPKGKEVATLDYLMKKTALYALPSMAEEAKSMAPKKEVTPSIPRAGSAAGTEEERQFARRMQGIIDQKLADARAADARPIEPAPIRIDNHNTGSELEKKLEQRLQANGAQMVRDYFAKHTGQDGAINVSTDAAKRMFPENASDPVGTDDDVRGAAFALHKAVWETALNRPVIPGRDGVVILTGTPGSGKTATAESQADVDIKREMLLTDRGEAEKAIHQIIDAGRMPIITGIFLDDPKENVRRMIRRAVGTREMKGIGRTVKIDYMGRAYVEIPRVLKALKDKFGDRIELRAIDNSGKPGEAKLYNGIDEMVQNASNWTKESAREAMHEELDRLREEGQVPDATYRAAKQPESQGDSGQGKPGPGGRSEPAPGQQERGVLSPEHEVILSANPIFDPRNWKNFNKAYDDAIQRFIDRGLKIGDKYFNVKDYDPQLADNLHLLDNAPRYMRDKAQANLDTVFKGLSEEQVRLASLMVDSDSRDYLRDKKPDEYDRAINDKEVMAAVNKFTPLQQELTDDRLALGWPVRRSLQAEQDSTTGEWNVADRDGNVIATAKTQAEALKYVEKNATFEPHLKRTYPEHMRQPLPFETGQGPRTSSYYNQPGIRPPKMDKKARLASAEYHYEHGAKDFSGYIESYRQTKEAMLKQSIYDDFTQEATKWVNGTAQPPEIDYNGETYYRPDVARKMREGGKKVEEYSIYDPTRGERFLVKNFEEGWAVLSTGKPGIGAQERWLAPKVAVDALEKYDASRGGQATSIRRFFQEQIVGLFGPMVHINNIVRRLGHVTGAGAFDPRSWPSIMRLLASSTLRDRLQRGVNDDTVDLLTRRGAYTDWHDVGSLHAYWGGNLNPFNWVRSFGKGVLFDPKFAGGWGGLDPKARVLVADYLLDHVTNISDQQIADLVNDAMGNYNRANWTERQRKLAYFTIFPGWDTASAKWFLRHPILTALAPALVTLLANLAMNQLGKNKDEDKYDFGYLHYGDRKYRTGLVTESMAQHLAAPVLNAAKSALEGGDAREVAGAAGQGFVDAGAGLASYLRPDAAGAVELIANRETLGRSKEIFSPGDEYLPGKVLPNRKLDKLAVHATLRAFPAARRFLAPDQTMDLETGVGSIAGISNYRYGAEERLKANEAKAHGYSETIDKIAATDPQAATAMVQDPDKAAYLVFHGDLATMVKDLHEIDSEIQRVKDTTQLSSKEKDDALKSLGEGRTNLLKSADALSDALFQMKEKKHEEEDKGSARSLLNRLRGINPPQPEAQP